MKTRSIIAATLLSITGAAFAPGEATYEYPQAISSAKSRAEVQAETLQAREAGLIVSGEAHVAPAPVFAMKSRSEVRALAAVDARRLPLNVEAISFDGLAPVQRGSTASRVAPAVR